MRFRRKIYQRVEAILKYHIHRLLVGDISTYELISRVFGDIRQTLGIARIRKAVEISNVNVTSAVQQMANKVRADKSCTASNQNFQEHSSCNLGRKYLRQLNSVSPMPLCAAGLVLVLASYSLPYPPRVLWRAATIRMCPRRSTSRQERCASGFSQPDTYY